MNPRLTKVKWAAVGLAARILEAPMVGWLNEFARILISSVLFPPLKIWLERKAKEGASDQGIRIFLRRSSTQPSNFHLLYSDLDIGCLVPDSLVDKIPEISRRLTAVRSYIPTLGEAEIYTNSEYRMLLESLQIVGPLYDYLRDIRKIGWMETAVAKAPSDYHRRKAERAIRKCTQRLDTDQPWNLGRLFPILTSGIRWDEECVLNASKLVRGDLSAFDCYYLGKRIDLNTHRLSAIQALKLQSILPPSKKNVEGLESACRMIRQKHADASEQFLHLSRIEELVFRSHLRGLSKFQTEGWMADWMRLLEETGSI